MTASLLVPGPSADTAARAPAAAGRAADETALVAGLWVAIALTVFEGPLRYGLNQVGADAAYFLRDLVMVVPLVVYVVRRLPVGAVPTSVSVFFALIAVHAAVAVLNLGTAVPAVYGLKLLLPVLCAWLVPQALWRVSPGLLRAVALMWLATVAFAAIDQFREEQFRWVGAGVELGGIDVQIGRDWQSGDVKRVAGLTRSSIHLANVLPLLSFVLLAALPSRVLRAGVCAATLAVLVWTTQKGAILGFGLAALAWAACTREALRPLKLALIASLLLMLIAPIVLLQFDMPSDQGVFSMESFIERIERMWPEAWQWIGEYPAALGVGLGGIGGAQRFYAPDRFNAADNLFVFLFANAGVMALVYLLAATAAGLRARLREPQRDGAALAALVFLFAYGIVISLLEDPTAVILLGAALGALVRTRSDRPAATREGAP